MPSKFTTKSFPTIVSTTVSRFFTTLAWIALTTLGSGCGGGGGGGGGGSPEQLPTTDRISPPSLSILGQYDTFGQSRAVLMADDFLYVADGSSGLVILQVPEDGRPQLVGNLPLQGDGRAYSIQKNGNYIYLTARSEGIYVIDVSNPALPEFVGALATPSETTASALVGNRLYVTASADFLIYDVSDASSPILLAGLGSTTPLQQLRVKGELAFIAAYNSGLVIVDLSDETAPKAVNQTDVGFDATAIEVNGKSVILGGETSLAIVDLSATPTVIATKVLTQLNSDGANITDFHMKDGFLYVAASSGGVLVADVSRPSDIAVVKSIAQPPQSAFGLTSSGRRLLVADGSSGVQVIDIFATTDRDGDEVQDGADALPDDPHEWADFDKDGTGDNADTDDDNDSHLDDADAFPLDASEWLDTDGDGFGDNSDVFVDDYTEWLDTDLDGIGNNADTDDDNDGILDVDDEFPTDLLNRTRITFDGYGNSYPNLDGNMISWRGYESNSKPTVFLKDLITGNTQSLSDGLTGFIGIPSLSNGQVAWRTYDSATDTMSIYFWDGFSRRKITEYPAGKFVMPWGYPPSYHSVDVILDHGQMAWAGWDGTDYEIYFWDGTVIQQITDNDIDDFEAQLNNGQIAWTGEEEAGGDWDIFYWDGSTIINVSNRHGTPDEDAHLMNGTIAWSGYTTTTYKRDIFFWDGKDTTIINVVGNDYEPQIDNTSKLVTWHSVAADGRFSIYAWTGTEAVQILPPGEFTVKTPFANEGRIAWVGYSELGADIYIGTPHIVE